MTPEIPLPPKTRRRRFLGKVGRTAMVGVPLAALLYGAIDGAAGRQAHLAEQATTKVLSEGHVNPSSATRTQAEKVVADFLSSAKSSIETRVRSAPVYPDRAGGEEIRVYAISRIEDARTTVQEAVDYDAALAQERDANGASTQEGIDQIAAAVGAAALFAQAPVWREWFEGARRNRRQRAASRTQS